MLKLRYISVIIFGLLLSCDDGDITTNPIDFSSNLQQCSGSSNLIIYKLKDTSYETLSIKLPLSNADYLVASDPNNETVENTQVLSTENTCNYRTYNGDPTDVFCNELPDASPSVTSDYVATTGTITFSTSLIEDDNDGILKEFEDINNNGIYTDDDTDGDGIPNYLDSDDDGDNIPTADEVADPNGDGNPDDAQNTDALNTVNSDTIPDYLDNDDDGDGVLTRNEDANSDLNPTNDITDPSTNTSPDYLNNLVANTTTVNEYIEHVKSQTYTCVINAGNLILNNASSGDTITFENYEFGVLTTDNPNVTFTVIFN